MSLFSRWFRPSWVKMGQSDGVVAGRPSPGAVYRARERFRVSSDRDRRGASKGSENPIRKSPA